MLVKQDLHIHTYLSPCANETATIEYYVRVARKLGLDTIAITDHMWDPAVSIAYGNAAWYHTYGLTPKHVARARDDASRAEHTGVRILFGCETEYDRVLRRPAISRETASKMEVLLAPNSHTHCTMPQEDYEPYERHADYLVRCFMDTVTSDVAEFITAIPHPFAAVGCPYDNRLLLPLIGEKRFTECFSAAAEANIAMEINTSCFTKLPIDNDPMVDMLAIAKKCGCRFTFGSDSHSSADHDCFPIAERIAEKLGLREENILRL